MKSWIPGWSWWLMGLVLLGTRLPMTAATLTVFAAASLTDCLKEIGTNYTQTTGIRLQFNFAGSSLLARQLEAGAPADVFFSADEASMDQLERRKLLLPGTRQAPLSNTLVVVVAADSTLAIRSPADLAGPAVKRLALGDPQSVPAGVYAKHYLERAGLWPAVAPKVIPTENVRAALGAVASGNVEAGIVYQTDAAISPKVKVAYAVPASATPPIRYAVAVLKDSAQPEAARRWVQYLGTPAAAAVFRRHGFLLPP